MADEIQNGGSDRQMYQGNWSCSVCGGDITQLPFDPDPARLGELKCSECHQKARDERRANSSRQMHQGNWKCSECGAAITELPFEPHPDRASELKCRDCFRK